MNATATTVDLCDFCQALAVYIQNRAGLPRQHARQSSVRVASLVYKRYSTWGSSLLYLLSVHSLQVLIFLYQYKSLLNFYGACIHSVHSGCSYLHFIGLFTGQTYSNCLIKCLLADVMVFLKLTSPFPSKRQILRIHSDLAYMRHNGFHRQIDT